MYRLLTAFLVFGVAPLAGATAEDLGLVEKGREVALQHCARCHVVAPGGGLGGIGSTPSFKLLVSLADGEERFVTFFERRPHGVFIRMEGAQPPTPLPSTATEIRMTADDLDAVVAYALSLK